MNINLKYQFFISSTYQDLREERQQVTQAVLEAGHFPSGMEIFPATDDTQWDLIKSVIDESDYYIVIVGGRYGSIGPNGQSYTEMEYDYAVRKNIPVLGFIRSDLGSISAKDVEPDSLGRERLEKFRIKVKSKTCRMYDDPKQLGFAVLRSIIYETKVRPRLGWVRSNLARSDNDRIREEELRNKIKDTEDLVSSLKRQLRDRELLTEEIAQEQLSQGDDTFDFTIVHYDNKKERKTEKVPLSWDELFTLIAPQMYGYVVRKYKDGYNSLQSYSFEKNIENHIRNKIYEIVKQRKFNLLPHEVDTCLIQFKELGLVQYDEALDDDGKKFRGFTLTEKGELKVTKARAITK